MDWNLPSKLTFSIIIFTPETFGTQSVLIWGQQRIQKDDCREAVWSSNCYSLCPRDSDSSCKFKNIVNAGGVYCHKHQLPAVGMATTKPVFRHIASAQLVEGCLYGRA